MARRVRSERVPVKMREKFNEITALTDPLCDERLNEEYRQLVREAVAALCRKRPSPLVRGRTDIWACGVVLAIGHANFLADPAQDPHMSSAEVCAAFGVRQTTGTNKSAVVRNTLGIRRFDPDWFLPSRLDSNPLVWMLEVNGLLVDARYMPREIQEIAYENGLIPYVPDDRENDDARGIP